MEFYKMTLSSPKGNIDISHEIGNRGVVTVKTDNALTPGAYVFEVEFSRLFDTTALGLYRLDRDGHGYLFTQFEAEEARKAFPCWDQPIFKIPYQLTLTVPKDHMVLSNTPKESEKRKGDWKTVVFEKTPPLPSYLIAIAAGPLETIRIPGLGVPGRIVTIKGQSHLTADAAQATAPLLKNLAEYFGRPYPYKKLDLIAVPEYWYGAMENPGAIVFREAFLVHDPETFTASDRRRMTSIISHELAHMWFGDLVTMEWWDDLWLNESFASWLGEKTVNEVYPEFKSKVSGVRGTNRAMSIDARPSTRVMRQAVENTETLLQSADALAYNKGQAVLEMFERWIGPDVFRQGVQDYINANAEGSVTSDDLWEALAAAAGSDISTAMASFLDQPGVPIVSAEVLLDGRVKLTQARFSNYGVEMPELPVWQIPLVMKYGDGTGVKTARVLLTEPTQTIPLEAEGKVSFLLTDLDAAGYYRWNVPPEMLAAIAENSVSTLTPRERVSFLGNLSALLDAGTIDGDDYLQVLQHFADDPEPQVISAMISGLSKVQLAFVPLEQEDKFAIYVRRALGPTLARFGLESRPGEDETVSMFRPQLIGWLVEKGHDEEILAHMEDLAEKYCADASSVDPTLADLAVFLSARRGDQALFEKYRQRFEDSKTPDERSVFLSAMGGFRDPKIVNQALAYSLTGPLKPQESFSIPGNIMESLAYEDYIYNWIVENYDAFTSRMPDQFRAFLPFIASGCSSERLAAARAFFAEPEHNYPGTDVQLAKVADQVTDCSGLREREGEAVEEYLARIASEN
jgi:alanyl aminopeptidase